jgi:hypothetical protein
MAGVSCRVARFPVYAQAGRQTASSRRQRSTKRESVTGAVGLMAGKSGVAMDVSGRRGDCKSVWLLASGHRTVRAVWQSRHP